MKNIQKRCGNGPSKVRLMWQLEKRWGNAARRVPRKNSAGNTSHYEFCFKMRTQTSCLLEIPMHFIWPFFFPRDGHRINTGFQFAWLWNPPGSNRTCLRWLRNTGQGSCNIIGLGVVWHMTEKVLLTAFACPWCQVHHPPCPSQGTRFTGTRVTELPSYWVLSATVTVIVRHVTSSER